MKVEGILLFDKHRGISSNNALQKVRSLYGLSKAGHTGTLDPFATGLLPICFGESTKFAHYLLNSDKTYEVVGRLGWNSSTGDPEGHLTRGNSVELPSKDVMIATLKSFEGVIEQVPPMFSAIKVGGERLYRLARKGLQTRRAPRIVKIKEILLKSLESEFFTLKVSCGKGTYIRTLISDLGKKLGCNAYATGLRRVGVSDFTVDSATNFQILESMKFDDRLKALRPTDFLLERYPSIFFSETESSMIRNGQNVDISHQNVKSSLIRAYDSGRKFMGIGQITARGQFKPVRLLSTN